MTDANLELERRGPVATVWLNRPDRHNAFDEALIAALTAQLRELDADAGARVVVLAGRGRSFCAGADLEWMRRMAGFDAAENHRDALRLAELLRVLSALSKPTIARVHGAALGGGFGLVAACDLAVASDDARFGTTEVRLGLIPAAISPHVIGAIGPRAARRCFLMGDRITATEARTMGLVHAVCAPTALDETLANWVAELLQGAPGAQADCKRLVADVAGRPLDAALVAETAVRIAATRAGAEAQAGLRAFFEKRKPDWSA